MLDEDEEIEDGFLQHANSQSMRVSWIGEDPESDIGNFFVAIGTSKGDVSVTDGYIDMGKDTSADIKVELQTFLDSGIIYYVAVKAENGAGILSNPMFSKPIKILKENIPGVIYDGREHYVDEDITNDKFSIAMHFQGFERIRPCSQRNSRKSKNSCSVGRKQNLSCDSEGKNRT